MTISETQSGCAPPVQMPSSDHGMESIPVSALQHAVYCMRQCALIHLERLWEENRFTAEGRVLHQVIDEAGHRRKAGVRQVMSLPIYSIRLNLTGVADMVEFHESRTGTTPFPVEFKRGKAKVHRADEVQLCAQALCLEEMTGTEVPMGAFYYGQTKRRKEVSFDAELRTLTETTVIQVATLFLQGRTPPAEYEAAKCRGCSLLDQCRPKTMERSVLAWRTRTLALHLAEPREYP